MSDCAIHEARQRESRRKGAGCFESQKLHAPPNNTCKTKLSTSKRKRTHASMTWNNEALAAQLCCPLVKWRRLGPQLQMCLCKVNTSLTFRASVSVSEPMPRRCTASDLRRMRHKHPVGLVSGVIVVYGVMRRCGCWCSPHHGMRFMGGRPSCCVCSMDVLHDALVLAGPLSTLLPSCD